MVELRDNGVCKAQCKTLEANIKGQLRQNLTFANFGANE